MSDLLEVSPECQHQSPAVPNTAEQAIKAALPWCLRNPGWLPIYLIPGGTEHFYKTWDELTPQEQNRFNRFYGPVGTIYRYETSTSRICKVKYGYILYNGVFVPEYALGVNNFCMVFKVGLAHPRVAILLLDHLEALINTHLVPVRNSGVYNHQFTAIPKAIRDDIVFYSSGWGWRLRKDYQRTLENRRYSYAVLLASDDYMQSLPPAGTFLAGKITSQNNPAGR